MIFDYNEQKVLTNSIAIDDIGNTAIRAFSQKDCVEYYLLIKTLMGTTSMLKFGPIMPDSNLILNGFSVFYQQIDYKENIISKNINNFINDTKKKITEAEEISLNEAYDLFPDIVNQFKEV